ncbi:MULTISPECIES: hypothetical protein [Pseudomonas]|uniref:Uncharacterized protein n=1 Tax=Phytopseudomonas flavescens TaxID=29435 RepID=A0A7Z0BQ25_9GAMM|nr:MULTISPECIES: hypothetical protein [Pseudomonas]MCW2292717.1 hypothetical protein [Pseudomonas sp. BIGb0408]NYH72713.1 hypothetical protein [Pseudomonas flavescens]
MTHTATVIDFTSYRKRRQARLMAEAMWAMYASRFSFPAAQLQMAHVDQACRS